MDGKWYAPAAVFAVAAAFGIVSALVVLSRRHPWLVQKKLRLGALLLTLSSASVGCRPGVVSCYVAPAPNVFTIDQADPETGVIAIAAEQTDTLSGVLSQRAGERFSYALVADSGEIAAHGDIAARDGAFDESEEEFSIILDAQLPAGQYELRLYNDAFDAIQDYTWYIRSYPVTVEQF
jgi:hypothetical protein